MRTAPQIINLDHNATTIIDPRVADAVHVASTTLVGNPSSAHALGQVAAAAIEKARYQVAEALGARRREVIFTGGATEANNLALLGVWASARESGSSRHKMVVGATEHPAVIAPARALRDRGLTIELAPVLRDGRIDLSRLTELIDEDTLLVSVMLANNETGVLNSVPEVVELARSKGVLVHTDATQAPGRVPVDFQGLGVDFLSVSAHKMHGPRGVGALLVDRTARVPGGSAAFEPIVYGGGQEHGLRPGTYNTSGIVGMGIAASLLTEHLAVMVDVRSKRDTMAHQLGSRIGATRINGLEAPRLPNTLNMQFVGADAEAVIAGLPQVACSTGSACSSGEPRPSHVLTAMGLSKTEASECLRFSLAPTTTADEIDSAVDLLVESITYVRSLTTPEDL